MNKNDIPQITFKEIKTRNDLFCQFDDHNGVLLLDVVNSFIEDDFKTIASIIDPYFSTRGELEGIIINSKKFPYWTSAKNRGEYLSFASDNHHKFKKAAFSMGGFFTKIIVRIASGRVHPQVKIFKYNEIEKAQDWILD